MVFISHSSKDRPTADAICAHLESAGIKCWIAPRDIEPGATWSQGIMQGLEACRVLVLVFSEHANDSDHVQREVAKAFSSRLAVIPFRIKEVFPNQGLSYFLDTVQWLDASAPPLQKHLGTLSERVKKLLVGETIRTPSKRVGPEKISVARLPVTGSDVFGREEDIAFLDDAWASQQANVVTIVAWAGVGKSTLVNYWLGRMAAEHYRSAELVFGWSFYRQGSSGGTSSADEFLDATLAWFGDPDPRLGTAWEKGERLAKLIAHRRTLLVLDGLEPLQNPPGPQEGRLREPSLQALLRELAAFNTGLCVITTRMPVADIADHERASALRRELERLSSDAGAKLLRAVGVKGHEAELRSAADEFSGHCLALTLLGSYLTDAYEGEIRCRKEVSERLAHDVRQGVHARKVMESYQTWFGDGPELSVLRMLGLFDRPADEKAIGALLKSPPICGLSESLIDLSPTEWRTILAKLRRARLLAGEDPHNPGQLDTHPLVREYFGEQLRSQQTNAWRECNNRLYHYYRTLAPSLPDSFRDMEPLFLAVICGCNAGLFREALHEVYIPRIQQGNASFAGNVLGAGGALLSVLVHFFEHGRWDSPVKMGVEGQSLTAEDQLFVLTQAGLYLSVTRGLGAPEARICYERAESLCHSLNRPLFLYSALVGQWRYSLITDRLTATMQIAQRIYSLAQQQNDSALLIGAYRALACTLCFLGDFDSARQYAMRGVQIWRSRGVQSPVEEIVSPAVLLLCYGALSEWHLGEIPSCQATMAEAISLAKELNDMHALAVALTFGAVLAHFERNPAEVERLASELIELATRHNFVRWLPGGEVLRGWARSAAGDTAEGISLIEDGIEDNRATGSTLMVPLYLALKAEASSGRSDSGNFLLYWMASQALWRVDPSEAKGLDATFAYDWSPPDLNRNNRMLTIGLRFNEPLPLPFHNTMSLGYVQNHLSTDFRPNKSTAWNTEHGIEFNILMDVAPMVMFQPVIQYYANAGGGSHNAVVLGFRTKVEF